jgi:hypothetical protein
MELSGNLHDQAASSPGVKGSDPNWLEGWVLDAVAKKRVQLLPLLKLNPGHPAGSLVDLIE